jgi:hypothetical protein
MRLGHGLESVGLIVMSSGCPNLYGVDMRAKLGTCRGISPYRWGLMKCYHDGMHSGSGYLIEVNAKGALHPGEKRDSSGIQVGPRFTRYFLQPNGRNYKRLKSVKSRFVRGFISAA